MKQAKKAKKLLASVLVAGSLCVAVPFSVGAATVPQTLTQEAAGTLVSETAEYMADGSCLTTKIYESSVLSRASSYQKIGQKMISYSDSNGKQLWDYTLYGTFTVNPGVSATCTSVTGSPKIYDNSWSVASNTPSRSGNKATGKITMQKNSLAVLCKQFPKPSH